ncbi:DUF5946 family protein [Streptomyces sp. Je 1-4]|uniref:DUF5946 family protein n=1 Tax=Streptomyces TaxID=1883 RepID=UPI00140EAF84|nr:MULTISPECIES: DUF5946 family protein [unclassified Streptomyces]QIK05406.1 hypothetical protein G7Z12_04455 [Streptomyces sp. ID38640]UYB38623.1 DUF5946 family protein [Streptomyces sp. Je 1-4]UZQ34591.1 DUF5946 family protein [Streptomyces sp. Je 1-4] [Streptomyces sp. Je 1-4 4N24]UZQ42009.1 DUF5946 family protein [Streptomyces sp. Je 1-4] [Streptomyces sp. Je 1-4 4N24_ara]
MESCAECGVSVGPRSCGDLFHALLALDHERQAPWGPLHGVSVSCFLFQHPSRLPADGGAMAWALLHTYLEGGLSEVNRLVGRARRGNSHRVTGMPSRVACEAALPQRDAPPPRFSVTIEDVAVDGTFPAEEFTERVRAWAAATVDAWSRST